MNARQKAKKLKVENERLRNDNVILNRRLALARIGSTPRPNIIRLKKWYNNRMLYLNPIDIKRALIDELLENLVSSSYIHVTKKVDDIADETIVTVSLAVVDMRWED